MTLADFEQFVPPIWSLLCLYLGFRMGRQVVIPGKERPTKVSAKPAEPQKVDIDNTHDDPWEAAMNDYPPERITGDMRE